MSDRLKEIRARLDAATPGPWQPVYINGRESPGVRRVVPESAERDLIAHAPADIAWLLEEVDNLNTTLNEWMAFCGSKECGLQRKAGAA